MSDKSWKAMERRLARRLGGQRIPVTGIGRGDRDVQAGAFWYQVKLRRALPNWIFDWLDGIIASALRHRKTGILVLKTPRMRDSDALVVLRLGDWEALLRSTGDRHGDEIEREDSEDGHQEATASEAATWNGRRAHRAH